MTDEAPDPAPTPAQDQGRASAPEAGPSDTLLVFVKDNLEAIAIAVVMALVIKHFCVEAFKIPTKSMQPTLLGDRQEGDGTGDRILVSKWAYLLGDPARWDVTVFRYPLDQSRNFIKRIAGLPGERLRISDDGDLWVRPAGDGDADDLRIPPKPRDVREQFYRPVYPPPPDDGGDPHRVDADLGHFWRVRGGAPDATWRLESHELMVYEGGRAATVEAVPGIHEHTDPEDWAGSGGAGELVRDVRVRLRVRLPEDEGTGLGPGRLTLRWRPDDRWLAVMTLSTDASRSEAFVRRGREVAGRAALGVGLQPGRSHDVEMEYVDGRLHAWMDGEELAVVEDGRRFADTLDASGEQELSFEAEGRPLHVEDVHVDRELRYENDWTGNRLAEREGLEIPPEHYFMLGDHVANSSDSRRWQLTTVHLRDGTTIRYDRGGDGPEYDTRHPGFTRKRVVDAEGMQRTWAEEDEDPELGSETAPAPFVHEDLLVGRAFLVFWPVWPDPPGRLGFIH